MIPESEGTCPFCEIASGADESVEVVASSDDWLAFFPLAPATPGHTLVIPRAHVPDFWSLDQPLAATLTAAAARVGKAIERALEPEGMNLITSSGEAAEQTVFHVHLHLVPRWRDDEFGHIWPPQRSTSAKDKATMAGQIRARWKPDSP